MAFSIPASVSQMRGGGLPWQARREKTLDGDGAERAEVEVVRELGP